MCNISDVPYKQSFQTCSLLILTARGQLTSLYRKDNISSTGTWIGKHKKDTFLVTLNIKVLSTDITSHEDTETMEEISIKTLKK